MEDLTRALNALSAGDESLAGEVASAIYAELRRMAAGRMAGERSDHTLQPTALVHEAYLRLAGPDAHWDNRRHFFGAAAEAMRRILVENARRRAAAKRGGKRVDEPLDEHLGHLAAPDDERLLQVHEVLDQLESEDQLKARIVKLRIFAGLGHDEIAALLGLSERTIRRHWEQAKILLLRMIRNPA